MSPHLPYGGVAGWQQNRSPDWRDFKMALDRWLPQYRGSTDFRGGRPFPRHTVAVGASRSISLLAGTSSKGCSITAALDAWREECAHHSCGAVAEFHRASRTFHSVSVPGIRRHTKRATQKQRASFQPTLRTYGNRRPILLYCRESLGILPACRTLCFTTPYRCPRSSARSMAFRCCARWLSRRSHGLTPR